MTARGQPAPDFSAKTVKGETFTLSAHRGRVVVVFFFPNAYSPICSTEVAEFGRTWRDFADLGAEVIGISCDDEQTQCSFSAENKLPYALISDPQAKIVELYGAKWSLIDRVRRLTYVIDPDGIVRNIFRYELRGKAHVSGALDATRTLKEAAR